MTRRRRIAIALAFGLGLGLLAVEATLRIWFVEDGMFRGTRPLPPFGATTNPVQRKWVRDRLRDLDEAEADCGIGGFDPELGWSLRPSTKYGRYASNRLGARGPREYPPEPPAGVVRLLCFGDSFTFCDQVDDDETWPSQIEAMATSCEAVNFGVGGYGTGQALLRFRRVRERLRGHVVTVGIMLENIGRNVNRYRPRYYPHTGAALAKPRFRVDESSGELVLVPLPFATFREHLESIADGSVVEKLAEHEFWGSGAAPFGNGLALTRLVAGFAAYLERDHRRLWQRPDDDPFRTTLSVLETFSAEACAWGAVVAPVVIFPAQTDLASALAEGSRYWHTLTDELAARGVPFVDVSEPLLGALRESGTSVEDAYVGGHLGPWANRVAAEAIFAWLEERLGSRLARR